MLVIIEAATLSGVRETAFKMNSKWITFCFSASVGKVLSRVYFVHQARNVCGLLHSRLCCPEAMLDDELMISPLRVRECEHRSLHVTMVS